jgi:hypothetical protein
MYIIIKTTIFEGEIYYALDSVLEIWESANDLTHFYILLFPDDDDYQLYKDDIKYNNDSPPFFLE